MGNLPQLNISVDRAIAHTIEQIDVNQEAIMTQIDQPDVEHGPNLDIHIS